MLSKKCDINLFTNDIFKNKNQKFQDTLNTRLLQVSDIDEIFEFKNKRKVDNEGKNDYLEYDKDVKYIKIYQSKIFRPYSSYHSYDDKLSIVRYNNNLIIKNQKDTVINPYLIMWFIHHFQVCVQFNNLTWLDFNKPYLKMLNMDYSKAYNLYLKLNDVNFKYVIKFLNSKKVQVLDENLFENFLRIITKKFKIGTFINLYQNCSVFNGSFMEESRNLVCYDYDKKILEFN